MEGNDKDDDDISVVGASQPLRSDTPALSPAVGGIPPATMRSIMARPNTRKFLATYWLFSFVIISTDEMVPLFGLADNGGGLHLQLKSIGTFIAAAGVIYVAVQYTIYKAVVARIGRFWTMVLGTALYGPFSFLVPFSLLFEDSANESKNQMGWPRFIFLGLAIGLARTFASMHFSSVSLLLNGSVVTEHRGTMNGLSMFGGSVAKAFGPIFAGTVYAGCVNSSKWSER